MKTPLKISGIGDGAQECQYEMTAPVATPQKDGQIGTGTFTAPIMRAGSGKNLPALLGLRSMEQQRALLDTSGRCLIIPGPGAVEISLPPGSVCIPLEKAPSGHLVMVVDDYEAAKQEKKGGLPRKATHFLANPEGGVSGNSQIKYHVREEGNNNGKHDSPRSYDQGSSSASSGC